MINEVSEFKEKSPSHSSDKSNIYGNKTSENKRAIKNNSEKEIKTEKLLLLK